MTTGKVDINKGRLLGAHCSATGGLNKAVERGGELGCSAIQFFSKNVNQWKAPSLTLREIDAFKEALSASKIKIAFAHTGYLINLATIDPVIHESSMESMRIELERAEALELPYVILHPGSHKGAGELVGIIQLVENLQRLIDGLKGSKLQILLETTAGQGNSLGYVFAHFVEIFERLGAPNEIGLCVDTAHIFEAGYDISTKSGFDAVFKELDETIGMDHVKAFHLNDSKVECGARVDRHEHVGKGKIGKEAFKLIMKDRRFAKIPMVIETPKGTTLEEDEKNLKLLRSFI